MRIRMFRWILSWGIALSVGVAARPASAQLFRGAQQPNHEAAIVDQSSVVLDEIMATPGKDIPRGLLSNAQGIAIVPGMVKGGFVVGVRHGRGVAVVRDASGNWSAPSFITITGGSVGWQAGVQATDVILVFRTQGSVRNLTSGKFTIGGDVAAAAGPVGRQASAATDASLQAEILSYSRSRGLFAGVALDGSAIQADAAATNAYYQSAAAGAAPGTPPPLPASAVKLLNTIDKYAGRQVVPDAGAYTATTGGAPTPAAPPVLPNSFTPPRDPRADLADSSRRLQGLLDDTWRRYLALPAEVYGAGPPPSVESLEAALGRYENVARNPQFAELTQRPEFRKTLDDLRSWVQTLSRPAPGGALSLPPPPR